MQLKLSAAISAALLLFSFNIHSDDHIQPTFIPVESFACNYADGKDMDDLLKVPKNGMNMPTRLVFNTVLGSFQ